jgi:hypothetical protein
MGTPGPVLKVGPLVGLGGPVVRAERPQQRHVVEGDLLGGRGLVKSITSTPRIYLALTRRSLPTPMMCIPMCAEQ